MKCIAIDDEPVALGIIRQFCQRSGDIELITFTDPVEGLQKVKDMHPDLVFLDIEMGGFNGIDVARQLPAGTFLISPITATAYCHPTHPDRRVPATRPDMPPMVLPLKYRLIASPIIGLSTSSVR